MKNTQNGPVTIKYKKILYKTDQNDPTVKAYVEAVKKGLADKELTANFTSVQLDLALWHATDILGRLMIPYCLVGQTGLDVYDQKLELTPAGGVYLAVKGNEMTDSVISSFKTFGTNKTLNWGFEDFIQDANGYHWKHYGVPVFLQVIKSKSKYFKNPEYAVYRLEDYHIPNPFKEYWKNRGLIR